MKRFRYTPIIPPPKILRAGDPRPRAEAKIGLRDLCALAGIASRVTARSPSILLHRGADHYRSARGYFVGLDGRPFSGSPKDAMRVLEVVAHGFHDYAAREAVCGHGYFVPPGRRGRPSLVGRAMSPAERMRRMRSGRTTPQADVFEQMERRLSSRLSRRQEVARRLRRKKRDRR